MKTIEDIVAGTRHITGFSLDSENVAEADRSAEIIRTIRVDCGQLIAVLLSNGSQYGISMDGPCFPLPEGTYPVSGPIEDD